MAEKPKDFGRRGRVVKPSLPEAPPEATPPAPNRKRTIALALATAGALAAAGIHFSETRRGGDCRPTSASPPGATGASRPSGLPGGEAAAVTGGGIGDINLPPCPPNRRQTAHGTSGSRTVWAWAWSSHSSSRRWFGSSSSSTHFAGPSSSTSTHVAGSPSRPSSAVSRGGFGATGASHASGGS